jgi:hypothetical protein
VVLKKSRQKANRARVRQRKQLSEQRQRVQDREKHKYTPEVFSFGRFLKEHKIELAFAVIVAACITGIVFLGPDKSAIKAMSASVSATIEGQSLQWDVAYPHGYKIIVFTDSDIIHTTFDTLPENLRINWNKLSVARIQSAEFGSVSEKVKITIPGMDYAPAGILGRTVTVSFIRKKGAIVRLAQFGNIEFVAEVIEDDTARLFCLFGLRGQ